MSFKLLTTIILVSALLSAGLLGYRLFYKSPTPSVGESTSGVTSSGLLETNDNGQINAEDAEYTRLLKVIGQIESIDRSILSSSVFISLFNFSPNIPNPTPGRSNPFAPIGAR